MLFAYQLCHVQRFFFHFVGGFFALLTIAFALDWLLRLIGSTLFILALTVCTFSDFSKKSLSKLVFYKVFPIFSSNSFIDSGCIFRCFTHLAMIFVEGEEWGSNHPILSFCACQQLLQPSVAQWTPTWLSCTFLRDVSLLSLTWPRYCFHTFQQVLPPCAAWSVTNAHSCAHQL